MWAIIFTVATLVSAWVLYKRLMHRKKVIRLEGEVQRRLEARDRSIADVSAGISQVPLSLRQEIVALDLVQLINGLHNQKYTALQVLRAYQWKAIESHQSTNCITQFIKEAEERAEMLDARAAIEKSNDRSRPNQSIPIDGNGGIEKCEIDWNTTDDDGNRRLPPLFGVPFSIKESIAVKGYDQTKGYAQELGKIASEDALIVQQIKKLGGVPFVLTNVPQSLLTFSCMNPVYGTTSNALAKDRTSGGSSGGEGALIGSGGSIIGIGSDVGGSIRYPCHFNGIAGIKPSHLRLSHLATTGSVPGRPLINASDGPMTRNISDCTEFLRTIWSDLWLSRRDPYVPPVTWNEEMFSDKRPLRIGYYEDDGWFTPTPALQRAVSETKCLLEARGHTLIPYDPPRVPDAFKLFVGAVTVDGGKYLLGMIDNDLPCEGYGGIMNVYRLPVAVQRIIGTLVGLFYPRMAQIIRAMPYDTAHLRSIYEQIGKYRHDFIRGMKSDGIDALLCPVQVTPAIGHLYPVQLFSTTSYCAIFNLLDFAAGTVPVSEVKTVDEEALSSYPETDPWYRMVKRATQGSVGLPVGVQVAAPPYHEETVLRILQEIEDSTGSGDHKKMWHS